MLHACMHAFKIYLCLHIRVCLCVCVLLPQGQNTRECQSALSKSSAVVSPLVPLALTSAAVAAVVLLPILPP